jgi:hypothetical protein
MIDDLPAGGRLLGSTTPVLPEIIVYPACQVTIGEGSMLGSDDTHYLRLELPLNNKEIRIPMARRALVELEGRCVRAIATGQSQADERTKE